MWKNCFYINLFDLNMKVHVWWIAWLFLTKSVFSFHVHLLLSMRDHHWIYNYLCNQFLLPLMLWVRIPLMARCTQYNTYQWLAAGLVIPGYFGFLHQSRWLPQYNWNIVEVVLNTVTAHSPKYLCSELQSICLIMRSTWYNLVIIFFSMTCLRFVVFSC